MAILNKIDSNITGLCYAEEETIGVLPGVDGADAVWQPLEPNSYEDFGGALTLLARNPINPSRQRKKGVVTDLEAAGGFGMDLTQTNLQDLLQGFMFADFRRKGEEAVTAVDIDAGNPDEYEVAATAGFLVGSLIKGAGFTNAANNAMNLVAAVVSNTSVEVATGLLAAEAGAATKTITVVGHQGATGDIDVDASGTLPAITSTALDFTTLGLIPGEWIFIGGDSGTLRFTTAANNGFKRIRSVAANRMEFDKSDSAMVTEANTTATVQLFFGRHLRNETGTSIVRRSYQLERTLGAPDTAQPAEVQSEYVTGAVPNELTLNVPTADKVTMDLAFVGSTHEQRDGPTGVKDGTRPSLVESDAFNTSSDFARIKMALVSSTDEAPTPLFAYLTELSISINNNVSPAKAVGVLGGFDVNVGTFEVSGELEAYFSQVSAIEAVQQNSDITLDFAIVKANAGMVFDLPLVALGEGLANVEQDQAVKLPLSMDAATAATLGSSFDYTLSMTFFDYLPTLADA
jgi:hypothetical protein